MRRIPVAIVGVSGFSGAELARLLETDPDLQLVAAYSDRMRGEQISPIVRVRPQSEADRAAEDAEIVALATPAETSAELAPKLLADGTRVIDLSGAFRLRDVAIFRQYYGFDHPAVEWLDKAHYGLPQLPSAAGDAPPIRQAALVANPGCYATAAILSLAPLTSAQLVRNAPLFVDGKSGVTGAGRKLAERYLFTEVAENVSLYRVADHQHTPEIELALSRSGSTEPRVTFAPHLLPIRRGLITTCFATLEGGVDAARVSDAVATFYRDAPGLYGAPVVEVVPMDQLDVHRVVGTPKARVSVKVAERDGTVVAACAIDNLLKGAASQALENLRRMVGVAP